MKHSGAQHFITTLADRSCIRTRERTTDHGAPAARSSQGTAQTSRQPPSAPGSATRHSDRRGCTCQVRRQTGSQRAAAGALAGRRAKAGAGLCRARAARGEASAPDRRRARPQKRRPAARSARAGRSSGAREIAACWRRPAPPRTPSLRATPLATDLARGPQGVYSQVLASPPRHFFCDERRRTVASDEERAFRLPAGRPCK